MCWTTPKQMLNNLGFPIKFASLLMECVMEPRFSILINGCNSKCIEGRNGFWQCRPLSPVLFILCSQLLSNAFINRGMNLGIKIFPNAQKISHMLYVNDVLLFLDAKLKNIKKLKKILMDYCNWIGQVINLQKSSMLFGKTIVWMKMKQITNILGFNVVEEMEYLGIKIIIRRLRKSDFQILLDKLLKRLNAWGNRFISLVRRLILVKTIFLTLPLFLSTHSLIPLSILKEFDKLYRNYIWDKHDGSHGIHFVAWDALCKSMEMGDVVFNQRYPEFDL
ncbi:hypothetical protein KFK09_003865 [Dendrobium nobile]|uniref:Reverse transcriptase domain-containing protein n=1 Tax=Dendrobium nobile TaxID=94219 RepID=A0A8T3C1D8_DENNO|nr:hypothetical protein KFK09_003865 [Dendrobium nobile]